MNLVGPPIVPEPDVTYKHAHMSKGIRLSLAQNSKPNVCYGQHKGSVNPTYLVLLVLVLVVGTVSLIAFYSDEFSLESRAIRGEAKAEYLLGKRYFDNAMSPRDYQLAAGWIRKAADQGYAKGQTGLGLLYENGLGVTKNYNEALKWLGRAANQGFPVAQNEIGVMYAKGRGVPRDLDRAAAWCRQAAAQGSEVARRNLELAEIVNFKVMPQVVIPGKNAYKRVVLQKVEADGVTVSFLPIRGGLGIAKLKLEDLPAELRELCGYASKAGADADTAYSQLGSVATTL